MIKYFLIRNEQDLSVFISANLTEKLENSIVFFNNDFIKPCFDVYPNPTTVIEGATPEEIAEANKPIVPEVITRRQFKIALAVLGKNEQEILNGINQLPEPTRTIATISYTEAGTFERSNPELIFVGKTFLQMTDEQIDNIFVVGSQY
jgi:hypothetical protein